jgi:hypothetical protein
MIDILCYQLAVVLIVALAAWYPCGCSGGVTPTCSGCETGTVRSQLQIDLSGVINYYCASCANVNTSFIIDWIEECVWENTFDLDVGDPLYQNYPVCSGVTIHIRAEIEQSGGSYRWRLSITMNNGVGNDITRTWTTTYATSIDCSATPTWSNSVASTSGTTACRGTWSAVLTPL